MDDLLVDPDAREFCNYWKGYERTFKCKALEINVRRIQVKDIVKEVEDYLKTYSSAGMDISCIEQLAKLFTKVWAGSFQEWTCIKYLIPCPLDLIISGATPLIPPPFGASSGNPGSPNANRVDTMPKTTDPINTTTTTNVAQSVDENLPQLLDSRGGSVSRDFIRSDGHSIFPSLV
nr:hypothetical protein [Tanacetum cinerariifolium]